MGRHAVLGLGAGRRDDGTAGLSVAEEDRLSGGGLPRWAAGDVPRRRKIQAPKLPVVMRDCGGPRVAFWWLESILVDHMQDHGRRGF